ncbi:pancreatic triacylglycerol lipase-like [Diprion similis]|uniref:pancreatic triacylglycerol lipase-like n=1 Tax=Diprion similis TaxID=362088 RepID=UPI001EF8A9BE|nr:pancreatic triacylglycerol lipase-like [Diprion similis]
MQKLTAYLEQKTHNFLYFNWETISNTDYLYAGMSVPGVGYTLAKVLNEMVAAGLNSSSLHLVGHSFGAQALGYVGRSVNFTVPRIVGLDPAGLLFYTYMPHLNSSDADYVEVIHTGMGSILSSSLQLGDVDFYPNGGEYANQGCTVLPAVCGHFRACLLYAESIRNKTAFIGRACDSYSTFKDGSCDSNGTVVMGYATPNTASGKYYLQTNSFSPYGRGEEGATYESITETHVTLQIAVLYCTLPSWNSYVLSLNQSTSKLHQVCSSFTINSANFNTFSGKLDEIS